MIKLNDRYDLKNIDMHCLHLSTFISHLYPQQTDIPDWLIISSGIKNVEFDVARLDMSFHVCKRAHEWISSFEDTIQKYVTELTRFTYIWGALESLVKLSGKRKRLVLQANEVLKNSLPTQGIIAPYNNLLNDLNEHIKFSQIHQGQLYKLFNPKYITNSCLGLHIINKIRNSFFHGDLFIPYPDEENNPQTLYKCLINICNRINLLTMQMILLSYFNNSIKSKFFTPYWDREVHIKSSLQSILHNIHFNNPIYLKVR